QFVEPAVPDATALSPQYRFTDSWAGEPRSCADRRVVAQQRACGRRGGRLELLRAADEWVRRASVLNSAAVRRSWPDNRTTARRRRQDRNCSSLGHPDAAVFQSLEEHGGD